MKGFILYDAALCGFTGFLVMSFRDPCLFNIIRSKYVWYGLVPMLFLDVFSVLLGVNMYGTHVNS